MTLQSIKERGGTQCNPAARLGGTQGAFSQALGGHDLVNNFGGGGVKVDIDALLRSHQIRTTDRSARRRKHPKSGP
jgi:hypothetical protein